MKHLCAILIFVIASLGACSNMTGLWYLDWQSRSVSGCVPDLFTINEDDQGNFTAVFNYTQITLSHECVQNFTGNYSSNLIYNATTNTWNDNTTIQLVYDNSTDTFRYLFNPTDQFLYDRNGSYIPQNMSLSFIGAVWVNITVNNLTNQSFNCIPSSILITPGVNDAQGTLFIVPTFPSSAPNCSQMNFTYGFIPIPNLQNLQWLALGANLYSEDYYIFDPYNSPNQLTVNITDPLTNKSICVLTAQRFTDFAPLNGTWLLDWQSSGFSTLVPASIQATPEDNNAYIATWVGNSLQANGSGYLVGGPNNQYFESTSGMGFTYDQNTNSLIGFSTPRFPNSVLYSPNGSLLNNNFVSSYWASPLLANGSNVSSSCCVPNTIHLIPDTEDISAAYYFDLDYDSSPSCQDISQYITNNPDYTVLIVRTPSTQELLWSDLYGTTISFANASTTSEITVQTFFGQPQCTFNMQITSDPTPPKPPLSATWISSSIIYIVLGIFIMLNWI